MLRLSPVVFLLAVVVLGSGPASAVDLHRLWEDRCAECHGHAGEFARSFLVVIDGRLYGSRPERDLQSFLDNHFLAGGEVEAVYAMLLAQARTRGEFKARCSGCHATAAQFARESLVLRDGVLYGRRSGRPVREFLAGHMNLSAEEAGFYVELLTRITREVDGRESQVR